MSETTQRREATRLRLIEAGIREYGQRGVDATSVEQLCETAGFSRGAFYSNFSSKEDLCLAIHRHIIDQQLEVFQAATDSLPQQLDVESLVRHILAARHGDKDVQRFLLELRLRAERNADFASLLAQKAQECTPAAIQLIQQAIDRAGVEALVNIEDLMHILDALFDYSIPGEADTLSTRLIATVSTFLTRPKEHA